MSAEWLRVLRRTEKLGRMSLFELWVAQIKLFLSWTSDILSFLSASKFPHQTFVTWWKNQNTSRKKKQKKKEKAGLVRSCQRSGLKTINADGQTLMNAGDQIIQNACALKKTPTFSCFRLSRCLFVLHSTSCRRKQKNTRGRKKKTNPALRFSARRAPGVHATDLAEISHWNICKQAPLKFPGAFGCLTGFQLGLFVIMFSSYQFDFAMHTEKRKSGAPWLICHRKSAIIELNYI